jgi:hypothetical protein
MDRLLATKTNGQVTREEFNHGPSPVGVGRTIDFFVVDQERQQSRAVVPHELMRAQCRRSDAEFGRMENAIDSVDWIDRKHISCRFTA